MRPSITQQITWVFTEDLDGTCSFYGDVLGLKLMLDQGNSRIFAAHGSSFLGVCKVRPERYVEPKGVVITLVTDEVDAWHKRLADEGFDVQKPTPNARWDIYHFFVKDPNGYLIEFQNFTDPRWRPQP